MAICFRRHWYILKAFIPACACIPACFDGDRLSRPVRRFEKAANRAGGFALADMPRPPRTLKNKTGTILPKTHPSIAFRAHRTQNPITLLDNVDSSYVGGDFGASKALDFDGERWYANPLCGESCMVEPWWENREGGEVVGTESSDALLGFVLYNEVKGCCVGYL